jgi:hypothetical protein
MISPKNRRSSRSSTTRARAGAFSLGAAEVASGVAITYSVLTVSPEAGYQASAIDGVQGDGGLI